MGRSDRFEVLCDGCQIDLSNLVSIHCAECIDEEYDLCVPCFAKGTANKQHKPWHDYTVIEQPAYPIFCNDWGADEEALMIEGLEQFGIGAWEDIAEHIGRRTPDEVADHYKKVYLDSPNYPMPHVIDHPLTDDMGEFMELRRKRLEKFNAHQQLIKSENSKPKPSLASIPACHEIQGYMPGRLEFETEAENEAETVIKNMLFEPDDSELDVEQKLTALAVYNSRLERRTERKRTILEHNLLEYRKLAAIEKKKSKEERELLSKLKPYVRLLPKEEFIKFTEDMTAELQYRHRIAELQEYRQNGIKTLEEANKYEKEKHIRMSAMFRTSQPVVSVKHSYFEQENQLSESGKPVEDEPLTLRLKKLSGITPLDVTHSMSNELLSPQERALCAQLRIVPKSYLAIKEAIIQLTLNNESGNRKKLVKELLPQVDDQRLGKLYDFFVAQNWIA